MFRPFLRLVLGLALLWLAAPALAEEALLNDPFWPDPPAETVLIQYSLGGRFQGQEVLKIMGGKRVRLTWGSDTAFGLERKFRRWELEEPERIVSLDLIQNRGVSRANVRGILSRLWRELSPEEKLQTAWNLGALGSALSQLIGPGQVGSGEASFQGLPAIQVSLGGERFVYWAGTDLTLTENRQAAGLAWTKTALDVNLQAKLDPGDFKVPDGVTIVEEEDDEFVEDLAQRIIEILRRPVVQRVAPRVGEPAGSSSLSRAVLWPAPPPPGFREEAARWRLSPRWQPFPLPPPRRPWPAPGLKADALGFKAADLAALLEVVKP